MPKNDDAALRQKLWNVMGDLPERDRPIKAELVTQIDAGPYDLEVLRLDLNGLEPVPAFFAKPKGGSGKRPTVLFNHSHGEQAKREMIEPKPHLQNPPYAELLTSMGYNALCIDTWNFGERRGRTELELFKLMLWHGQVLWGMMVYDNIRALDYLCSRDDVDTSRVGTLGLSMGSTMAWWTAALDERIALCVDICCITDFQALIDAGGLDKHGIYYYVPSLLKEWTTGKINALIAPRPHLALAGDYDLLTPVKGLERTDAELKEAYSEVGAPEAWKLLRCPCGHMETFEMRAEIVRWLKRYLG